MNWLHYLFYEVLLLILVVIFFGVALLRRPPAQRMIMYTIQVENPEQDSPDMRDPAIDTILSDIKGLGDKLKQAQADLAAANAAHSDNDAALQQARTDLDKAQSDLQVEIDAHKADNDDYESQIAEFRTALDAATNAGS